MPKSSSNESPNDLADTTTYRSGIAQASAFRIVKKHTTSALKDYDLTCMQWFTIGIIYDAGPSGIRLTDLAEQLDTTLAYMTTMVNMLESRGIATKTPHDKDARTKMIAIQPSYRKQCKEIEAHVRRRLAELLYGHITKEELYNYIQVLCKISELDRRTN